MIVAEAGTVYLVGAGPGDPDLLTRRAAWLIETATCILHDDLVSPEIVQLAGRDAIVRNVGKRSGHKSIRQETINDLMIARAREGHSVVRLKSGDPMIFGRAGEEIDALNQAGIPFAVVPGVSAAFAAASAARVSLTDRRGPCRILLTSGYHARVQSPEPAPLSSNATVVRYMPGSDYGRVAQELLNEGWPGDSNCLLVSSAGRAGQSICRTTVDGLAKAHPLPAPVVMILQPQQNR